MTDQEMWEAVWKKEFSNNPTKWILTSFFEKDDFTKTIFNKMLDPENHIKKFDGHQSNIFQSGLATVVYENVKTINNKKIDIKVSARFSNNFMEFEEAFYEGIFLKAEKESCFVLLLRQIDLSENITKACSVLKENKEDLEQHDFLCKLKGTPYEYEFEMRIHRAKNYKKNKFEYTECTEVNGIVSKNVVNGEAFCFFVMRMGLKNGSFMFMESSNAIH